MARPAQRVGATPTKRLAEDGDICPVCKSSRYLNPNMRFMLNPECYHKMCESCVDRIFSHGPAPCPIAGCKRTLRKNKFRDQTFEDLRVEREVDIRLRVGKVFNKTQDDFETLRDYNDYLEVVEETIWNLINRTDVAQTEARLRQFAEAQKQEEAELFAPSATATPRDSSTPDPSARNVLKKTLGQRKGPLDKTQSQASTPDPFSDMTNTDAVRSFTFKGLKKRVAPEPEKPYDAFGGWSTTPQYYVLQDVYDAGDWINKTSHDPAHIAGGWDIKDYYTRALCDAFSGFGVFVEDEMAARPQGSGNSTTATSNAAIAATAGGDVNMDDVF